MVLVVVVCMLVNVYLVLGGVPRHSQQRNATLPWYLYLSLCPGCLCPSMDGNMQFVG